MFAFISIMAEDTAAGTGVKHPGSFAPRGSATAGAPVRSRSTGHMLWCPVER
jgi:hypothetical protein